MSADAPSPFDQALVALGDLVAAFGPEDEDLAPGLAGAPPLWVERVSLNLPFELAVATREDGNVQLGGAPPTQHLETTFMPVLHRLRLRIVRDGGHGS